MYKLIEVTETELIFEDGSRMVFRPGQKGSNLVYDLSVMRDKIGQEFDITKIEEVLDAGALIDGVFVPIGLRSSDGRFTPWTDAETFS